MSALRPEDQARCLEYIDGELDEAAQLEFERRLAHEPELALAVEQLLATDRVLREQLLAPKVERLPWHLRLVSATAWVAAAAIVLAVSLWFILNLVTGERSRVAFVASHESPLEALASAPELRELRPEGLSALRGSQESPNISAEEFLRVEAAVRERQAGDALERRVTSGEAGFFRIEIELEEDSIVYVQGFAADGEQFELQAAPLRLPAGRHELPRPRFSVDPEHPGTLRYDRGYLVPVGCGTLEVFVATVPAGKPLDSWPTGNEPNLMDDILLEAGAKVHNLTVREPR